MSTEANANSSGGAFGSNSDTLSSAVPMLDEAGKNWGVFLERFKVGVQAKRRWGHFDGTKVKPTFVAPSNVTPDDPDSVASVRAAAEATRLAREEAMRDPDIIKKREEWDYSEAVAYYLLIQKVPEGILKQVNSFRTVAEKWAHIQYIMTDRSMYARVQLRREFLESRCAKGVDVRTFLEELRLKKQELDDRGIEITREDYLTTITRSIPYHLSEYAATTLDAAEFTIRSMSLVTGYHLDENVIKNLKNVDPDYLIRMIQNEADRRKRDKADCQESP